MKCPKCNSENVTVQMITEQKLKETKKKHGCLYWLFIGWWLKPLLWLFFTVPMIIIAICRPKKQEIVTNTKKMAVCNNCGNSWEVKKIVTEVNEVQIQEEIK